MTRMILWWLSDDSVRLFGDFWANPADSLLWLSCDSLSLVPLSGRLSRRLTSTVKQQGGQSSWAGRREGAFLTVALIKQFVSISRYLKRPSADGEPKQHIYSRSLLSKSTLGVYSRILLQNRAVFTFSRAVCVDCWGANLATILCERNDHMNSHETKTNRNVEFERCRIWTVSNPDDVEWIRTNLNDTERCRTMSNVNECFATVIRCFPIRLRSARD